MFWLILFGLFVVYKAVSRPTVVLFIEPPKDDSPDWRK